LTAPAYRFILSVSGRSPCSLCENEAAESIKELPMSASNFAISTYPDVADVMRRRDALKAAPIRRLRQDALDGYVSEYFGKGCPKSKAMIDEAKEYIPGGVQHNLAFNYPFPLVFEKAAGPSSTWTATVTSTSCRRAGRRCSVPIRRKCSRR